MVGVYTHIKGMGKRETLNTMGEEEEDKIFEV